MQSLSIDQIKSLVNEIKQPRWKLMVLTGFWHGLRASELTSLRGADIRDGFVDCKRLKGSLRTIQPYVKHQDPDLDESAGLAQLAKTLGPKDLVFPITRRGLYGVIARAGARAGLPKHKLHPHILKHSIARQSIAKAGIENVRQWLGHKSMSSTGAYLKVSDDEASRAISSAVGASLV
jgi:integrase